MFFVIFEDGIKATEADFGDWDHVPQGKPIKQAGLLMPPPMPPIILPQGERYYIARIGAAPLGGVDRWMGYVLISQLKDGSYQRITAKYDGIIPDSPAPAKLNIRESAWRGSLQPQYNNIKVMTPRADASVGRDKRTLLFATMYIGSEADIPRYRKYLDYYIPRLDALGAANLILMDDGSDLQYLRALAPTQIFAADQVPGILPPASILTFPDHLGRNDLFDFPGWWRSFLFPFRTLGGFNKIIHIESDAFIYTERLFDYLHGLTEDWTVLWCPRHKFPEMQIQVVCGKQIDKIKGFAPYELRHFQADPERHLPFTHIEKSFKGDRYGEYPQEIPSDADFAAQTYRSDY